MDKTVIVSSAIVIGVVTLAAAFHTGLMIGPRYKLEKRRNRTALETDEIYYPDNPILERSSSCSSGSSGYESARGSSGSFGGKRTKRFKRI